MWIFKATYYILAYIPWGCDVKIVVYYYCYIWWELPFQKRLKSGPLCVGVIWLCLQQSKLLRAQNISGAYAGFEERLRGSEDLFQDYVGRWRFEQTVTAEWYVYRSDGS